MTRRSRISVLALVLTMSAVAASAFWSQPGTGAAAATTASLDAAAITAPGAGINSVTVTWSTQSSLNPSSAANSSITYSVERKLDGGAWAAIASGGCSGVKPRGTTSCVDAPATAGSYSYRAVANFHTWTATSNEVGPVSFSIDTTPPAVSALLTPTANGAGWNSTSPVAVALSASDGSGSGVASLTYTIDGSDPTSSGSAAVYTTALSIAATTTVKYFATDVAGNASSVSTQLVKVDTSAPNAPTLAFSALTNSYASGNTLFYRSAAASGAFTVTASATDAGSAIASYAFPTLPAGWSASPGALGVNTYSWSPANPTAPSGAQNITATNNASLTSTATGLTLTSDNTAPTGTITYTSGYYTSTSVSVGFSATDGSGSGVNTSTRLLQRAEGTLTASTGLCTGYGAFATVSGGSNPTSPFIDTTVTNAHCYQYRYLASDNVGAQGTITSADVAKVDTSAPPAPTAVTMTSATAAWGSSPACGVTGTRYINAAGQAAVVITATIAAAEAGETVLFSATSEAPSPVTVTGTASPATGATTAAVTLNLSSASFGEGAITITARRQDAAGNQSGTASPINAAVKDTVAATPANAAYRDNVSVLGGKDDIYGTYECGGVITAVKTVGGSLTASSSMVGAGDAYDFEVSAQALSAYSYNVTAVDRAGNTSAIVVVSGSAFL